MRIVLAVTRMAIRSQPDLGDVRGNVTGLTIEATVGAGQRVPRLGVMIEAPSRPTIRVVAERAVRTQTTVMMPVPVAGVAAQWCSLEQQRPMALLARHDRVTSNEWKPSEVVIEGRYSAPVDLYVALLAAASEPPFVPVILQVTRYTRRRQLVAIEIASVAGIALGLCVRGPQRESGLLVMIKANRAPLVRIVAAFALGTIPLGVNILKPVAIDARSANPLVAFTNVARGTEDGPM